MKTTIIALVTFIAGGVIVGLVMDQRNAMRAVHTRSDVYYPMRAALYDIVVTHDRGDHALAEAKVRMLAEKWNAFMNGDKVPEQFAPLVESLTTAPATQPAK